MKSYSQRYITDLFSILDLSAPNPLDPSRRLTNDLVQLLIFLVDNLGVGRAQGVGQFSGGSILPLLVAGEQDRRPAR